MRAGRVPDAVHHCILSSGPDRVLFMCIKRPVVSMVAIFEGVRARRFISPETEIVYQILGMNDLVILVPGHDCRDLRNKTWSSNK